MEKWKQIKGYEKIYEISDKGRVRSEKRKGYSGGVLSLLNIDSSGYNRVGLSKDKKRTQFSIHRLVAEAFILNPKNKPEVNHIDENKNNNCVNNLEWVTSLENKNHSLSKKVFQYDEKGNFIKEWNSANEASRNGFTQSAITNCCNGIRRLHKKYIWSYHKKEKSL